MNKWQYKENHIVQCKYIITSSTTAKNNILFLQCNGTLGILCVNIDRQRSGVKSSQFGSRITDVQPLDNGYNALLPSHNNIGQFWKINPQF